MVLLVVIMAISLVGNGMVVCVYKSKYKKRTSSFFIMIPLTVFPSISFEIEFSVCLKMRKSGNIELSDESDQ